MQTAIEFNSVNEIKWQHLSTGNNIFEIIIINNNNNNNINNNNKKKKLQGRGNVISRPRLVLKRSLHHQPGIKDYLQNQEKITQKCAELLTQEPYNELSAMNQKWQCNIFCPFHEVRGQSRTPSGRLYIDRHRFYCYSTNCNKRVSTKQLLNFLLYKNKK